MGSAFIPIKDPFYFIFYLDPEFEPAETFWKKKKILILHFRILTLPHPSTLKISVISEIFGSWHPRYVVISFLNVCIPMFDNI